MSDAETINEVDNIDAERPSVAAGWTLVGECHQDAPAVVLQRIREVWRVVAGWGRSWDDPDRVAVSPEEALAQLPPWFKNGWPCEDQVDFECWLADVDERDWVWWSGAVVDSYVKVDLKTWSMPMTARTVRGVMLQAGATIIYNDVWIPPDKVSMLTSLRRKRDGHVSVKQLYPNDVAYGIDIQKYWPPG